MADGTEAINIQGVPSNFRPYLKAADEKGDKNGSINTNQEAQTALATCQEKQGRCEGLKKLLESYQFQLTAAKPKTKLTKLSDIKAALTNIRAEKDAYKKYDKLIDLAGKIKEANLSKDEALKISEEIISIAKTIKGPYTFGFLPPSGVGREPSAVRLPHFYLPAIAVTMAKSGLDINKVKAVFSYSLEIIQQATDSQIKSDALLDLAQKMAEAGLDQSEVKGIFDQALQSARTIENRGVRAKQIAEIGAGMFYAKLEPKAYLKLFDEAIKIANGIKDRTARNDSLASVIEAMADSAAFNQALSVARKISNNETKADSLLRIAQAMLDANIDKSKVRRVLAEALVTARKIGDRDEKVRIISRMILPLMIKAEAKKAEIQKLEKQLPNIACDKIKDRTEREECIVKYL
jgi:hypothetical protein